jgi:hypothetical protein
LFPGEKSSPAGAVAPPPELSPATGEKRESGREGKGRRKEGTVGEGPEKKGERADRQQGSGRQRVRFR